MSAKKPTKAGQVREAMRGKGWVTAAEIAEIVGFAASGPLYTLAKQRKVRVMRNAHSNCGTLYRLPRS